MTEEPAMRRVAVTQVEVGFVGTPPARQVARAPGVSEVEIDGSMLRCRVWGSFQPFLEALRGYEVLSLQAIPAQPAAERNTHTATSVAPSPEGGE